MALFREGDRVVYRDWSWARLPADGRARAGVVESCPDRSFVNEVRVRLACGRVVVALGDAFERVADQLRSLSRRVRPPTPSAYALTVSRGALAAWGVE